MSVRLVRTIAELREMLAGVRRAGRTIGLVPTMGALHAGHGRLIEQARGSSGLVVVTLFVNPIQFNRNDDYERYPRALDDDLAFCDTRGAGVLFAPAVEEMYPREQLTFVEVSQLAEHLCGAFRPGHFRGVATVVAKLFHIVQPDLAFFGEKDAQQLALIRRMVDDLNLPVRIVGVPTVREEDGLALSSRNRLLSRQHRAVAPALYRALLKARSLIEAGERDANKVCGRALAYLQAQPGVRVEYLQIVDPDEMQPVNTIAGPVRVAAAMWLGSTRLIDSLLVEPGRVMSNE